VEECAEALGISRSTAYRLLKDAPQQAADRRKPC
jgi:predicted DNA-binding transcriptional regulator AlpA